MWVGYLESEAMSRFLHTLLPNPMTTQIPHRKRSMKTSKMVLGFPRMATWMSSFTYYNFFQENFRGVPQSGHISMSPMRESKSATWKWVAKNTHRPHFSSPTNSQCLWQVPLPNQCHLRPRALQGLLSDLQRNLPWGSTVNSMLPRGAMLSPPFPSTTARNPGALLMESESFSSGVILSQLVTHSKKSFRVNISLSLRTWRNPNTASLLELVAEAKTGVVGSITW